LLENFNAADSSTVGTGDNREGAELVINLGNFGIDLRQLERAIALLLLGFLQLSVVRLLRLVFLFCPTSSGD
jgi:hypothetical protein